MHYQGIKANILGDLYMSLTNIVVTEMCTAPKLSLKLRVQFFGTPGTYRSSAF